MGVTATQLTQANAVTELQIPSYVAKRNINGNIISTLKLLQDDLKAKAPTDKYTHLTESNPNTLYLSSQFHKENPNLVVHPDEALAVDDQGALIFHQRIGQNNTNTYTTRTIIPAPEKKKPEAIKIDLPTPAPQEDSFTSSNRLVLFDPGHGSKKSASSFDNGTSAMHNGERYFEEQVVEDLVLESFVPKLDQDYNLRTSRNGNLDIESFSARVKRINSEILDIAKIENPEIERISISVHADWSPKSSTKGTSIYVADDDFQDKNSKSYKLAEKIAQGIKEHTGNEVIIKSDIESKLKSLGMCRNIHAEASILIEAGYISNLDDLRMMTEDDIEGPDRAELSAGLKAGIDSYFTEFKPDSP